jgi:hypothetical protein
MSETKPKPRTFWNALDDVLDILTKPREDFPGDELEEDEEDVGVMPDDDFAELILALEDELFPARSPIWVAVGKTAKLSSRQICAMLDTLNFPEQKQRAARILKPACADVHNWWRVEAGVRRWS